MNFVFFSVHIISLKLLLTFVIKIIQTILNIDDKIKQKKTKLFKKHQFNQRRMKKNQPKSICDVSNENENETNSFFFNFTFS